MGRQLGVPAIFLKGGWQAGAAARFTIARGAGFDGGDIVTTGLSSRECIAGIAEEGGDAGRRLPG
jgi:hypothetical protein